MRNRLFPTLLAGLLLMLSAAMLAMAPAAPSATTINDVARALRQGPVYVDPAAADQLSASQADALTKKIKDADKPVFVAVLPRTSAFPEATVLRTLRNDTGITGVYGIRLGDTFKLGADRSVMSVTARQNLSVALQAPAPPLTPPPSSPPSSTRPSPRRAATPPPPGAAARTARDPA